MSLNKFNRPLSLKFKPSRLLQYYLYLLHALVLLAVVLAALPFTIKVLLSLLVLASLLFYWYRYGRTVNSGMEYWVYTGQSNWKELLEQKTRRWKQQHAYRLADLFVVIVLKNTSTGDKKSLLLVRDQIDAADFRRLKVILASQQHQATVKDDSLA